MPPLHPNALLVRSPRFNLNTAGVAGFFGGEEAISAMDTVHLYEGRQFLGWFNSPGSYTIAKCFGKMANSGFWNGLFPGPNHPPAISFGLDGKKGPRYIAALSGTTMNTGHLAYLTMEWSKDSELTVDVIQWRETTPCDVAYLAMKHVNYDTPVERLPLGRALPFGIITIIVSIVTCVMCALVYDWYSFGMILFGIVSSGWASLVIGKGRLNIKFVNPAEGAPPGHGILIGEDGVVVIKGEERDVNAITKGRFILETDSKWLDAGNRQGSQRNQQSDEGNKQRIEGKQGSEENKQESEGSKQGTVWNRLGSEGSKQGGEGSKQGGEGSKQDGEGSKQGGEGSKQGGEGSKQDGEGSKQGSEGSKQDGEGSKQGGEGSKQGDEVKGQTAENKKLVDEEPRYDAIGVCSLILLVQFLAQLLLVPQGTLFGQIMFLISLAASWSYNSYLSSLEKEKIQTKILFKKLGNPKLCRFRAGTRTTMAVFACLLLFHEVDRTSQQEDSACRFRILRKCIPNDTPVWNLWREKVVEQLLNTDDADLTLLVESENPAFSRSGNELLTKLLGDARAAFRKYFDVRDNLPTHSTPQGPVEGTESPGRIIVVARTVTRG